MEDWWEFSALIFPQQPGVVRITRRVRIHQHSFVCRDFHLSLLHGCDDRFNRWLRRSLRDECDGENHLRPHDDCRKRLLRLHYLVNCRGASQRRFDESPIPRAAARGYAIFAQRRPRNESGAASASFLRIFVDKNERYRYEDDVYGYSAVVERRNCDEAV